VLKYQQLRGLIMWVPGSLVYVAAALLLAARWLRAMEDDRGARRGRAHDPASSPPVASPRI
jgi:cytochrome c oxidase assembly factor CtaG